MFGSRMLTPKAARQGGMPLYKYMGNKVLTRYENAMAGANLSEWHSGYRAYSVEALQALPFEKNDDDFNFDSQIIVQLLEAGRTIKEIPIPTFYGDEICYVDGVRYARLVTRDVTRYRAHKLGFGTGELAFASHSVRVEGVRHQLARAHRAVAVRPAAGPRARPRLRRRLRGRAAPRRRPSRRRGRPGAVRRASRPRSTTSSPPTSTRACRPRWWPPARSTWSSRPT